jgi:hypothetical protein
MGFVRNVFRSIGNLFFGRQPRIPEMPKPVASARDILPSTTPTTDVVFNRAGSMSALKKRRGRSSLLIGLDKRGGNGSGGTGLNV